MQIRGEERLNLKGTPVDVIVLLKCVQRENVGQIFGLFKHAYCMDRHLEQKVTKQRLRCKEIMRLKLLSAVDPQII